MDILLWMEGDSPKGNVMKEVVMLFLILFSVIVAEGVGIPWVLVFCLFYGLSPSEGALVSLVYTFVVTGIGYVMINKYGRVAQ